MEGTEITINISPIGSKKFSVKVNDSITIAELKKVCEEESKKEGIHKVIFKGKILKDD
jgi:hypothetical protein